MSMLQGKRVLVTGGAGFLGRFIVEKMQNRGAQVSVPRRAQFDLRKEQSVDEMFAEFQPQVVVHAAAVVGGIGFMQRNPGTTYFDNLMMNTLVVEKARQYGVEKFVGLGTICAYPKFTPVPFKEQDLWNGYPEETNAPYGLVKKMMLVQTQAYRRQFGFHGINLLIVNLYGPHDNFDAESSHVIPALIRKCVEAHQRGRDHIVCWGDGAPTREFIYVEDAAEAVVRAAEVYDKDDPINIGAGFEISMKDLAHLIARLAGFNGEIHWDSSRPNGQPRRRLDVTRAEAELGFRARTDLEQGLKKTLAWYEAHVGIGVSVSR